MRRKEPFQPGDKVIASYRVPPFLADEILVVDCLYPSQRIKGVQHWRVRVYSAQREGINGYLDGETLTRVE